MLTDTRERPEKSTLRKDERKDIMILELNLFDGEAAEATAPADTSVPAADAQPQETAPATDKEAEFEKLIKGEYRQQFDKRIKDNLKRRFKESSLLKEKAAQTDEIINMLKVKYGINHDNMDDIVLAIKNDDGLLRAEAQEKGIEPDTLKRIRELEFENESMKNQIARGLEERKIQSTVGLWIQDAKELTKDFPDFDLSQFKHKVENMLVSALQAIDAEDVSILKEPTKEIKKQVENQIFQNQSEGVGETYEQIRIHQTEITDYVKRDGTCKIVFQSALEYLHYQTRDGKVIAGDAKRLTQTKYNVEVVYIQDEQLVKIDNAVGTTCPSCGAPVKKLGAMYCEYCGLAVIPLNLKVWTLHKYYEV